MFGKNLFLSHRTFPGRLGGSVLPPAVWRRELRNSIKVIQLQELQGQLLLGSASLSEA